MNQISKILIANLKIVNIFLIVKMITFPIFVIIRNFIFFKMNMILINVIYLISIIIIILISLIILINANLHIKIVNFFLIVKMITVPFFIILRNLSFVNTQILLINLINLIYLIYLRNANLHIKIGNILMKKKFKQLKMNLKN